MKIISIVGARPQFIKLAPLSIKIRKYHEELIIHTGQHYDNEMSKNFFEDLNINEPDYNLGVFGGSHGEQTGNMIIKLEKILKNENPDLVIVFGDTNSTLSAALASVKLGIKIVHVEAGLRSYNKTMPEEINRVVSDHVSDFLFAPTNTAIKNLEREGLITKSYLTGDIMVDSLEYAKRNYKNPLTLTDAEYNLLTLHRPYNVDNPEKLQRILNYLTLLEEYVIFPVHPRTKQILNSNKINYGSNIDLINPVGYFDFISLESNAKRIITDSGGIQKEAYILRKPCITLRSETEWEETVSTGWNLLLDIDKETSISEKILHFNPPCEHPDIFGKDVSIKMTELINNFRVNQ